MIGRLLKRRGLRVASVCSGVGGLDLGLARAGHDTVFLCEWDAWRRKVLARHFPGVPIHHDLEELTADDIPPCDIVVGGTPCTNLSRAGNGEGLEGEESRLYWDFAQLRLDLFARHGCAWSLWENVEGAFSTNGGRDFAAVLSSHVGADVDVPAGGWSRSGMVVGPWGTAEWRLLDAQFFGVAQRRRRVFVVGHLGATDPVEILADAPRRARDFEAGSEARPEAAGGSTGGARVAGTLTTGGPAGFDDAAVGGGHVVPAQVVGTLTGGGQRGWRIGADEAAAGHVVPRPLPPESDRVAHTLTSKGFDASEDGSGRATPAVVGALTSAQGGVDDNSAQAGHDVARPEATAFDNYNMRETGDLAGAMSGMTAGNRMPHVRITHPDVASTLKGHVGKGGGGDSPEDTFVAATLTAGAKGAGRERPAGRRQEDDVNVVPVYDASGWLGWHPPESLADCGCPNGFVDGNGFCACCQAHLDDPDGWYALQGAPDAHSGRSCPFTPLRTVTGFHATQSPISSGGDAPALGAGAYASVGVAISENQQGELVESGDARALTSGGGKPGQGYAAARVATGVRRLTPTECERLMGWPDGWTLDEGPSLVEADQTWPGGPMPNDPAPDGRRYSACGDGVAAPCGEWVGLRLLAVA